MPLEILPSCVGIFQVIVCFHSGDRFVFSGSRCSTPALNRGFLLPLNIFAPVLEEEEEEGGGGY